MQLPIGYLTRLPVPLLRQDEIVAVEKADCDQASQVMQNVKRVLREAVMEI
jgi:hypothetical protein